MNYELPNFVKMSKKEGEETSEKLNPTARGMSRSFLKGLFFFITAPISISKKTKNKVYEKFGSRDYDLDFKKHPLSEIIIRETKKSPILDVGCGNGNLLKMLKDKGFNVQGFDPSKVAVDFCHKRKVNVILSDIKNYNSKKKFKTILMIDVINSLSDYEDDFKRVCSWLEENGKLIFNVANKFSLRHFFRKANNHFISKKEIKRIITNNNLIIEKRLGLGRLKLIKSISAGIIYITKKHKTK